MEVSDCWWARWGHEAACCRTQGTSELVLAHLWVELPFKVGGCRAGRPRCGINLLVGRACFFAELSVESELFQSWCWPIGPWLGPRPVF